MFDAVTAKKEAVVVELQWRVGLAICLEEKRQIDVIVRPCHCSGVVQTDGYVSDLTQGSLVVTKNQMQIWKIWFSGYVIEEGWCWYQKSPPLNTAQHFWAPVEVRDFIKLKLAIFLGNSLISELCLSVKIAKQHQFLSYLNHILLQYTYLSMMCCWSLHWEFDGIIF